MTTANSIASGPRACDTEHANRGEHYTLTLDEAGASTPNYCLIEKLRVTFGLEVSELIDPAQDSSGIDLSATFDAVRRAIARTGLHFRVEETVHLAILQFAKFPLWKDLDDSWKALSSNSLVSPPHQFTRSAVRDTVLSDAEVDLDQLGDDVPVPADSSQLHAIAEAAAGCTFVLEGPPGTGKSQTITNLLAHAMAAGRRVLFVAEKRAALDVVKKRLEAVGLGDLSLDLHDKSSRPAAVREQIRAALDLRINADTDSLHAQVEAAGPVEMPSHGMRGACMRRTPLACRCIRRARSNLPPIKTSFQLMYHRTCRARHPGVFQYRPARLAQAARNRRPRAATSRPSLGFHRLDCR